MAASSRQPGHRQGLRALVLAAVFLANTAVWAEGLTYRIEGASAAVRENLRAYLGPSPRSDDEARRFQVTAPLKAAQALEALGYYDHSIGIDYQEESSRLILRVEEGEPLTYTQVSVEVLGDGVDDPVLQEFLSEWTPALGDPVHHGRYESLKAGLQQAARARGYFDASFLQREIQVDVREDRAELTLRYDTGVRYRFGPINHDSQVLRGELMDSLKPYILGEPYQQRTLLELRQRLLRLGYFSSVVVVPDLPARKEGVVPVRVDLDLAPRHSYELGVGYSTDTRQRLSMVWRSPRLNSRGHSQQTSLRWSPVNPELRTIYSIPLDDPANDVLQLVARFEDNEYGDLDSRQASLGIQREWTGDGGVRSLSLRGLGEEWGAFDEDFSARFLLAGASLSNRYRRGDAVDPSAGLSQFYSLELAGKDFGSDEDVLRFQASVAGVRRFSQDWRMVARGELGFVWSSSTRPDELPPSLSFFAGGDNSIRGYGYQSIGREVSRQVLDIDEAPSTLTVGGNRLVTGSLEVQRYFGERWRGALFVDAGDAFLDDDFDLNVGVGFGIHYLSPIGALRLEIADPVSSDEDDWRIHINIGAEF